MKIIILITLCLLILNAISASNLKVTNKISTSNNSNSKSSVTSSSTNESKENPKFMDSVVSRKAIPIVSSDNLKNTEGQSQLSSNSNTVQMQEDTRFKEKDFESPQIVPSIGFGERYDIQKRMNVNKQMKIDPLKAYDIVYKNHQHYYDKDKKMFMLDHHFYDTEDYINKFSQTIANGIASDKDLVHVSDIRAPKSINLESNPLKFNHEAVKTTLDYGEMQYQKSVLTASSNPYNEIISKT
jgi:hypothetical protein